MFRIHLNLVWKPGIQIWVMWPKILTLLLFSSLNFVKQKHVDMQRMVHSHFIIFFIDQMELLSFRHYAARALLQLLSGRNRVSTCVVSPESAAVSTDVKCQNLNVLVTSGSLIPTLVKCLLFRLDDSITHGNSQFNFSSSSSFYKKKIPKHTMIGLLNKSQLTLFCLINLVP